MSVGANCFLNSIHKDLTIGPNPTTERGKGLQINAHPTLPLIIYPSGKFVVVKNVNAPNECFIYRGHASPVTVAKFSPNGFWIASGDTAGKVRVWSWDNPEHLTKLETVGFGGAVNDLDWDSESKKLALVGEGSDILVKCITWDTGNSAGEMVGHSKRVLSVAFKQSRPFRIMTGGEDMRTVFYAGPPFKLDHSDSAHSNFVNCVRFSPNGAKVVSVGSDKKIQVYDGATGQPCGEVANAHDGGIYSAAFSPDSAFFLTASADKTVKLWNAETLALETTFTISAAPQLGDAQVAVLWTPHHLLSVSLNGNINVLDRSSPSAPARVLFGHQTAVTALYADRATGDVFTGSADGVVCTRNLTRNSVSKLVGADPRSIPGGVHSNMVTGLLATGGDAVRSIGWDDVLRTTTAAAFDGKLSAPTVSLAGQPCSLVGSAGTDLQLVVTNSEAALFRGEQKVAAITTQELGFTPTCGSLLGEEEVALGGTDSKTHIYSIADMRFTPVTVIETRSAVSAVSYAPTRDLLAIGDAGRQVEVYERGSWAARVKGKWVFHTSRVTCLAWSPSGRSLASGSLDENIFVWSIGKVASKVQLAFAHTGGVTALDWLSEAQLVSAGNDHTVVTWRVPTDF